MKKKKREKTQFQAFVEFCLTGTFFIVVIAGILHVLLPHLQWWAGAFYDQKPEAGYLTIMIILILAAGAFGSGLQPGD